MHSVTRHLRSIALVLPATLSACGADPKPKSASPPQEFAFAKTADPEDRGPGHVAFSSTPIAAADSVAKKPATRFEVADPIYALVRFDEPLAEVKNGPNPSFQVTVTLERGGRSPLTRTTTLSMHGKRATERMFSKQLPVVLVRAPDDFRREEVQEARLDFSSFLEDMRTVAADEFEGEAKVRVVVSCDGLFHLELANATSIMRFRADAKKRMIGLYADYEDAVLRAAPTRRLPASSKSASTPKLEQKALASLASYVASHDATDFEPLRVVFTDREPDDFRSSPRAFVAFRRDNGTCFATEVVFTVVAPGNELLEHVELPKGLPNPPGGYPIACANVAI
jgi:hypothetical protein